jgi:hypothetical protein
MGVGGAPGCEVKIPGLSLQRTQRQGRGTRLTMAPWAVRTLSVNYSLDASRFNLKTTQCRGLRLHKERFQTFFEITVAKGMGCRAKLR